MQFWNCFLVFCADPAYLPAGSVKSSPIIFGGRVRGWILSGCLAVSLNLSAQTNATVRVMAANLNGNTQSYQPFAIRILQGLKPDIV